MYRSILITALMVVIATSGELFAQQQNSSTFIKSTQNISDQIVRYMGSDHSLTPSNTSAPFRIPASSTPFGYLIDDADSLFRAGYDLQTNKTMPNRIINWGKNGVGPTDIKSTMIYMGSNELASTGTPSRGTYGAVLTQPDEETEVWLPINFNVYQRIEPGRTGFCALDYLKTGELAGSIVAVSHNFPSGGVYAIREGGAGAGIFLTDLIPGSDLGLWPRVAVDGENNIHVVHTFQGEVESQRLMYLRFDDQLGQWGTALQLAPTTLQTQDGQTIQVPGCSEADSYQITANGSNVAVVWFATGRFELWQAYSSDYGKTWLYSIPVQRQTSRLFHPGEARAADSTFYYPDPRYSAEGDTIGFYSDTVESPGYYFDVMMTDDGDVITVHNVLQSFITNYVLKSENEDFSSWRNGTRLSIIYFLSNQINDGRAFHFRRHDSQGNLLNESYISIPEGLDAETTFLLQRGFTANNYARWPQFGMNGNGNIFMLFGSARAGDTKDVLMPNADNPSPFYLSHTYGVRSNDGGNTWSRPLDLTPEGIDAQFASLADWVDDELHIVLQADLDPGDAITSDTLNVHPDLFSSVEVMILPSSTLTLGTEDATRTSESLVIQSPTPNPAVQRTRIQYSIPQTSTATLSIVDMNGSVVSRSVIGNRHAGSYQTELNVERLPNGQYRVILEADGRQVSTTLHVVR